MATRGPYEVGGDWILKGSGVVDPRMLPGDVRVDGDGNGLLIFVGKHRDLLHVIAAPGFVTKVFGPAAHGSTESRDEPAASQ